MVEQSTQLKPYSEWTCNRAWLFNRLIKLRESMRVANAISAGNKFYILNPVQEDLAEVQMVFDRKPLLDSLNQMAFSVYCDLRESNEEGAEIGIDILHQIVKEG